MSTLDVAGIGLPFFELGSIDLGIQLQWFGILVATGVLLGAGLARRYGDRYGIDDDDLRGMTAWLVVSGFVGAHVFDVLAYQQEELKKDPLLLIMLWKGISSYGGFIGGAIGFFTFVWWKRLNMGLWADISIVGLLLGFTMGRVGCTVVHDHMGRPTDFALGVDYPREWLIRHAYPAIPSGADTVRIHNLGLYELLYLLVVCAIMYWVAFRKKPTPAGLVAIGTGLLYAPVRFFLDYLRLNETDPRYLGLTFAQWASIAFFLAAAYAAFLLIKHGKPATRKEDLGPKQIGGRRDPGPRLTKKDLAEVKKPAKK